MNFNEVENIGNRIKEVRKQKNLTIQRLSEMTDLSIGYLSNLERNQASPTLNIIHSERYAKLKQALTANAGRFEFLPGIKESPWRIAVLRLPLYDILYGTYKQAEQVEALKQAIADGINLMIQAME